jgi:hypothetical protein
MLAIMMSRDGSIVGTLYWVRNANMDWIYLYLFSAANTFIILVVIVLLIVIDCTSFE